MGADLQRSQVIDIFREILAERFSPAVLTRLQTLHLHQGTLTAVVSSAAVMHEFSQRKEELLAELRRRTGARINDLKTVI